MKFIYLGKKQNFLLDKIYAFQQPLNRGNVFELEDDDIILMNRCIKVAAANGIPTTECEFMRLSEYESEKERKQMEALETRVVAAQIKKPNPLRFPGEKELVSEPEQNEFEEVTVDLNEKTRPELFEICKELGIKTDPRMKKQEIIDAIKQKG